MRRTNTTESFKKKSTLSNKKSYASMPRSNSKHTEMNEGPRTKLDTRAYEIKHATDNQWKSSSAMTIELMKNLEVKDILDQVNSNQEDSNQTLLYQTLQGRFTRATASRNEGTNGTGHVWTELNVQYARMQNGLRPLTNSWMHNDKGDGRIRENALATFPPHFKQWLDEFEIFTDDASAEDIKAEKESRKAQRMPSTPRKTNKYRVDKHSRYASSSGTSTTFSAAGDFMDWTEESRSPEELKCDELRARWQRLRSELSRMKDPREKAELEPEVFYAEARYLVAKKNVLALGETAPK